MSDWVTTWLVLLLGGVGTYAVMAVIVAIGGARDIRKLFRSMTKKDHTEEEDS